MPNRLILYGMLVQRSRRKLHFSIGYSASELRNINRKSIALLEELRNESQSTGTPMVISGCIGPRGDGYQTGEKMTADQARTYHFEQIKTLSNTAADLVSAFTINYGEEAIGITRAAQDSGIPVVISFTVEADGRLPSGQTLGQAIADVDRATRNGPAYYMINCAHPTHFTNALPSNKTWVGRIRAVRANASDKSHDELDEADHLDDGNPSELGSRYAELTKLLPNLTIFGGCCGTDHRHVEAICRAVTSNN